MKNEFEKPIKKTKSKSPAEKKKNPHENHRKRMLEAAKNDTDLENFSDFQIVEFFLQSFIPRKDTNVMAHDLIDKFHSIYGICTAPFDELYAISGMTVSAARFLSYVLPFARRASISQIDHGVSIDTVDQCAKILQPYFENKNYESFYILMLDLNNRIVGINSISRGVANFTDVDLNKIVARVTNSHAVKVFLAHNHPAGSLEASQNDCDVTASIAITLNAIGKELVDHLIFTSTSYMSFYRSGIMTDIYMHTDRFTGEDRAMEVSKRQFHSSYVLEPKRVSGFYAKFYPERDPNSTLKTNKLEDLKDVYIGKNPNPNGVHNGIHNGVHNGVHNSEKRNKTEE